MTDPKDKEQKDQADSKEQAKTSTQENNANHWDPHQSVDEEGNELSADDIK